MASPVLAIPQALVNLVQTGLLERAFHDSLYPALLFRSEAMAEEWPGHIGTQVFESRASLLTPVTTPLQPGVDPQPQTLQYEQWVVNIQRYGSAMDTHLPTSFYSNADQFMRNLQQFGLQAAQSVNQISRNALFQAYLSGQTLSTVAGLSTDTQIQVASVNGFIDVVLTGTQVRPVPVSAQYPLPISIVLAPNNIISVNVIGYTLNNMSDPSSPGVLLLSAALGQAVPIRTPVLSSVAPTVIRAGGGNSVDAITSGDTATLQDFFNAVSVLRQNNVQPHEDGFYHAHLPPNVSAQLMSDRAIQNLFTANPDHAAMKTGFIGQIANIKFFMNAESPNTLNTGLQTATTSAGSQYAFGIGAETINYSGVYISRTIVTGRGHLYERWVDEDKFINGDVGVTGKIGQFDVVNQSIRIQTDRVRLVIRSPIDRFQDVLSSAWSISAAWPVPSDVTSNSGSQRFKRAVVVESAT